MKTLGVLIFVAISWTLRSQSNCDVKVYLDLSGQYQIGHELDPTKTSLDSLIIGPHDIEQIDKTSFTFTLTKSAAQRLRNVNLDFKCFTLVINNQRVLAGWFWGCDSSIGTNGYVTYNLNCGYDEKDEIKIDYSLPRQSYPDPKILDNVCQQRIWFMIGRVALLVTFKKAKPKPQSLSRSHIRDLWAI